MLKQAKMLAKKQAPWLSSFSADIFFPLIQGGCGKGHGPPSGVKVLCQLGGGGKRSQTIWDNWKKEAIIWFLAGCIPSLTKSHKINCRISQKEVNEFGPVCFAHPGLIKFICVKRTGYVNVHFWLWSEVLLTT